MEYCAAMRFAALFSLAFALACSGTKQELPKGPAPEYEDEPVTAASATPPIVDAGLHE